MKTTKIKKEVLKKEIVSLFAIVVFAFCFILTACENREIGCVEEKEKQNYYFLLLKDDATISLNTYKNGRIKEHRTFTIPENSLFATDGKERVAILDIDNNLVTLYEIETSTEIELSVPFRIRPKAILINSYNLFVGGETGFIEMLAQYHIENEEWYPLELPQGVYWGRRAIDDLVVNDSLLIAIDNVVMPKYILFYHLNSTGKLAFSHFEMLKPNGAWETIRQGRITPEYLGILSQTRSGYIGIHDHIAIYNDLDLTSSFVITIRGGNMRIPIINDFILMGDKVFIAHRENGLGIFEIKDSYFSDGHFFNEEVDSDKINFKPFENEELIRLTKIPETTKIVLTIRNEQGNIRHEIMNS